MKKKIGIIFLIILCFIFGLLYLKNTKVEMDSFYIEDMENKTVSELFLSGFEENEKVTVGQLLVFYSRINGNNVSTFEEARDFCYDKNIYLPSDLVYNKEEWLNLWKDIIDGNIVFEKINENSYSLTLISGYLKIYLNQQGFDLLNKGLIPPQLYFYSPFSSIQDFTIINYNKNVSLGFVLEILMNLECNVDNRIELLSNIVVKQVKEITGKEKVNWGQDEINIYNYYSLSYYSEYMYFKQKGFLTNIELNSLLQEVTEKDFLKLYSSIFESDM